jgi:putative acetyltransferase
MESLPERRGPSLTWIRNPSEKLLVAKAEGWNGMVSIRLEIPEDAEQIRDLLRACFPGYAEADLVEALRRDGDIVLSLVAEEKDTVLGCIVFSRLTVTGDEATFPAVALAPLAVYAEYQQQGVATRLVREAHACLAAMDERLCIVLGEPTYYGRFGYSNRRASGFTSDYQSPYLLALSFGAAPWDGRLDYPPAFRLLDGDDAPLQADHRV